MHRYRMWKLGVMLWNKMGRNFGTLPAVDKSYKQVSTSNQAADANSSIRLGLLHISKMIILFVSFKSVIAVTHVYIAAILQELHYM